MKRSLLAILILLGCASQVAAADQPHLPAIAAETGVAAAAKAPRAAKVALPAHTATPTAALQPWPQEASDLKADPDAVWGKLDNGMRYVILPSKAPGRAAMQLSMRVGSLMEAADQQGMAHFLEHMIFNGTKHFPAGEMVEYFQRLGMNFGPHTNAYTTWDQTVYQIQLPRTTADITGDGLKLFRDVLDGMLLEKKEIDRERRVILSEMMYRDGVDFRSAVANLEFTLPGTLVSKRMPIGKTEALQAMTRERFVDFYETWYTPARATLVAVGNFDVKMLERLIGQNFGGAKARRGEQPDPDFGAVIPTSATTAKLSVDAEAQSVTVDFAKIAADPRIPDTFAKRRQDMALHFADAMLGARFGKLARGNNSPILGGSASFVSQFNLSELSDIAVVCQAAQWKEALGAAEQELRRALTFGFDEAEFNEVKAATISSSQSIADQAETLEAPTVAGAIINRLSRNVVTLSPSGDLALLKRILSDLTKEECEQALRKTWQSPEVNIMVKGNLSLAADDVEAVLDAYRQSRAKPVTPPSVEKSGPFAYTDFGPAGKIVKRQELKDLGIIETTFANNVRVNVKRTDRDKNMATVQIRFGGGTLELPADKPGLALLADGTFIGGGLEAQSLGEFTRALADKNCHIGFGVDEDAFRLGGGCSAAELETELDLCMAYLTAPGFRPESLSQLLNVSDSLYSAAANTPEGVLSNDVSLFMHGGDPRFGLPARDELRKLTLDDVKAWLRDPLRTGYMEVAIVGDIDPERALQLAAKTLGALPERAAQKPAFKNQRRVKFPVGVKAKDFHVAADTPRALSVVVWPVLEAESIPRERRLAVLCGVLNDRLRVKIRQELGATYTPIVAGAVSDVFADYGYIDVELFVEPKQVAEIGPLVVKMAQELAEAKLSDDEFERALKPTLSSLDDLDNDYWARLVVRCQERPDLIEAARNRKANYHSIKKEEIEALAKKYLTQDKALVIGVSPAARAPVALGK